MRLLYVCSDFGIRPDGTKGASIHLRAITRALAEAGHEITLLSPKAGPGNGHPARRLLGPGCPPADESGKLLKRWMVSRGLGDALAKELRPLLYNAWVLERAKAALAERPVDAILERLSLFGHMGLDLADALDVPLIVEVNALLSDEARRFRSLQLTEPARTIEQRVLEHADALLPVSQELREHIAARGIPRDKIHVVPNGADVERFAAASPRDICRERLGLDGAFTVGFVGSLKVWHGVEVLIRAFARLLDDDPSARLLIVGTGPSESALRDVARQERIEGAVVFTGAVAHEDVPAWLRAMDVAVAPFLPMEGFYFSPIKLFEYMAAGTCVVASRLGQIRDVIEHEVNGLLCQPGDPHDLHQTLRRLRQSAGARRNLSSRAFQTVRERFTWTRAAATTSHAVREALVARQRRQGPPSSAELTGDVPAEVSS